MSDSLVLRFQNPRSFGSGSRPTRYAAEIAERLTDEEVDHILRICDALWLHSGKPEDPHAEITSKKCSNGFVDTLRVLKYPNLCDILAYCMAQRLHQYIEEVGYSGPKIEWVIGSDHAGAVFSQNVARWLGARHDFTEKGGVDGKQQIWRRFEIKPDEPVLQVEELVTTTQTLNAVRSGVREGNPHPVSFVPFVCTLIHRSRAERFEGSPILYLRHYDIETWEQSECPLCAAGSKRLKPKHNWAELTKRD